MADKKREQYRDLVGSVRETLSESRHWVTNTANVSALVYYELRDRIGVPVNWVGFYLKTTPAHDHLDASLYLGPFQGEVACVAIPNGKGVCGASAKSRKTVVTRAPLHSATHSLSHTLSPSPSPSPSPLPPKVVPNVHEFPGHIACSHKTNSEIVIPMISGGVAFPSSLFLLTPLLILLPISFVSLSSATVSDWSV